MKDVFLVVVLMSAGVVINKMVSDIRGGITRHTQTLQTVVSLVLALACLRHGWPMK